MEIRDFHISQQKIYSDCDHALRHNGILTGLQEYLDLQVLLDPLEEELHLQALLGNNSNRLG